MGGAVEDEGARGRAREGESPQLRALRRALYDEFRGEYARTVTGLAYEVYVQGRPLTDHLSARQERKIQSFAERFAHAFNVVSRVLLEQ